MERIQESRLTILERCHSPYERRSELTFGSMESPVQHVGRHRRFAYQSHRKRTSRVAIPYRKRRFRDDQGTVSLRSHQKALYPRR